MRTKNLKVVFLLEKVRRVLLLTKAIPNGQHPVIDELVNSYGLVQEIEVGFARFAFVISRARRAIEDYAAASLSLDYIVVQNGMGDRANLCLKNY